MRDRDPDGRPRNARPRDGLGRPLPRSATGVERIPDDLAVAPRRGLALAQQLLDDGLPFAAHEVLEAVWKSAPDDERELWQGLAQLAVGLTHLLRGNPTGAATVLRRGQARIARYLGAAPHGIDVAGLTAWADAALAAATSPPPGPGPDRRPDPGPQLLGHRDRGVREHDEPC